MDHVPSARQHDADGAAAAPAARLRRGVFLALCLALAAAFAALGVWQVERLQWKRALIARVEARLAAAPAPLPAFADWSPDDAYTRVTVSGVFLHDRETPVQAVTERGAGWWVVTPLRTPMGLVLVNRGFAPTELKAPQSRPLGQAAGPVRVTGLLRASEPGGAFLRRNAPADGRWYSRDVAAIARAKGLAGPVAPFFIDADATPNAGGYPVGGLTVVRFRNSHLAYALTWFGLCGLSLAGAAILIRSGRRA
ncbi:MAG: SURF1 family protein [Caulobacteraceae bacterium]|nr:SURF1 family protein [Caulobacteraceae bacterium]